MRKCEEHSLTGDNMQTLGHFVRVLPCFLIPAFVRWFAFSLSAADVSSPCITKRKRSLLDSPRVPHNQIFDLMKGFNYLLLSTGGVTLLSLLFIFPAIYHCPDSKGVYACAALPVCVDMCVCVSAV